MPNCIQCAISFKDSKDPEQVTNRNRLGSFRFVRKSIEFLGEVFEFNYSSCLKVKI